MTKFERHRGCHGSRCTCTSDARDGLPALVDKFGSVFGFIQNHLPGWPVSVRDFRVPKFKISLGFEATEVLQGQGLVLPFSPDGLTKMVENGKGLKISCFFHNSCIEVDEQGTEAAAALACLYVRSLDYLSYDLRGRQLSTWCYTHLQVTRHYMTRRPELIRSLSIIPPQFECDERKNRDLISKPNKELMR
ncbi:serpin-zx [Phtheirospermum japonicum]|uniref:Serpin-zx n=1 Tax=Phtheirospermum japonicum TaxID=374723 RepID=A0A830BAS9_9LAMI|nr:serpin-zx [Phtheirospermum japonicum]